MQTITTPNGEVLVILPLTEYERLVDAADVAAADRVRADLAAGRDEMVPAAVVDRLLAGENRIRVWREHRGLSARELARRAGISGAYVSELESGRKNGRVEPLQRLAVALGVDLDDLVPPVRAD